jgi:hypothetical protein
VTPPVVEEPVAVAKLTAVPLRVPAPQVGVSLGTSL